MSISREWKRVTESSVLRAWAIAETTTEKAPLRQAVREGRLRDKLLGGRSDDLSEPEWQALERAILQTRGPMLTGLLSLRPDWHEGDMPVSRLADMRFFNVPAWTAKTPSRNFGDLAGRRHLPGVEPEFRGFATRTERPIAVAASLDGPFCLIEGYTRCASLLRDHRAGMASREQVPMVVGVTPRIAEWSDGRGHPWW